MSFRLAAPRAQLYRAALPVLGSLLLPLQAADLLALRLDFGVEAFLRPLLLEGVLDLVDRVVVAAAGVAQVPGVLDIGQAIVLFYVLHGHVVSHLVGRLAQPLRLASVLAPAVRKVGLERVRVNPLLLGSLLLEHGRAVRLLSLGRLMRPTGLGDIGASNQE